MWKHNEEGLEFMRQLAVKKEKKERTIVRRCIILLALFQLLQLAGIFIVCTFVFILNDLSPKVTLFGSLFPTVLQSVQTILRLDGRIATADAYAKRYVSIIQKLMDERRFTQDCQIFYSSIRESLIDLLLERKYDVKIPPIPTFRSIRTSFPIEERGSSLRNERLLEGLG